MTEVTNTNTTSINFAASLGIDNLKGEKLIKAINANLGMDKGIEDISYTNGQLEIKHTGNTDALAHKLQTIVFSSKEMKEIFGEDIKNVDFELNADNSISLTTNSDNKTHVKMKINEDDSSITWTARSDHPGLKNVELQDLKSDSKNNSDDDNNKQKTGDVTWTNSIASSGTKTTTFEILELLKLLISAFSEIATADRERALYVLNATVAAFDAKIKSMEEAAEAQYKSAISSAIGQIVGGVTSAAVSIVGAGFSMYGLRGPKVKGKDTSNVKGTSSTTNITKNKTSSSPSGYSSIIGQTVNNLGMPFGKIVEGISNIIAAEYGMDKSLADINTAKADALLETLKQAHESYMKGSDSLQQFIDKILRVLDELIKTMSQTETSMARGA